MTRYGKTTMRVAMWYHNRDVRVEEMPVPEIGAGELLVRVEACGICGSDVMRLEGRWWRWVRGWRLTERVTE